MAFNLQSEEEVKEYIKNLGTEYRFGCLKEKNPEVCHLLGDFLESINKDYHKAGKVYKTNCDDYNFAKSCFKTGFYYISGKGGFERSADKSLDYYQKGCDLGDTDSCFKAGVLNIMNTKAPTPKPTLAKGAANMKKSCDANHADACHHLSCLHMEGNSDPKDYLPKDMKKAFEYAIKSCQLGNIHACVNVSIMYKKGEGVNKDETESEKYKKIAIEKQKEREGQPLVFQQGLK